MTSTHAGPQPQPMQEQPVRLWLLLLAGPIGYLVGTTVGYDYGLAASLIAALTYTSGIGAFAVFGSRCWPWLAEHRAARGTLFALFSFVTLVGLHVFTPDEDLVIAITAGLVVAAFSDES